MKREEKPPQAAEDKEESAPRELMDMDITIYLQDDGQVVITDMSEELSDLVKKLDPQAEIFCAFENPMEKK